MGQPFIGEIRMFAGNFAPAGWMFCDGSLLAIADNDVLFNLIGTTYGGDGQVTFALPDLRGRLPIHQGNGFVLAQTGGQENVTLTSNQIAAHSHAMLASNDVPLMKNPANHVTGQAATKIYRLGAPTKLLGPSSIGSVGGSQPHNNFQPYLCVEFIISLFGIFPSP
jgi:microcystin-dependent protein